MEVIVRQVQFSEIECLRNLYRAEANCQIRNDSLLGRGLADAYLILVNGRVAGYAGVRNKYDPGHLMEYYVIPSLRGEALPIFREVLRVSGATRIEAQTNISLLTLMLFDCAENIRPEAILFEDARITNLPCPAGHVRPIKPEEHARIFDHKGEPVGDIGVEVEGEIVGTAGAYYHYNPPYADIYMEVAEPHRRKGYGAFLVQEVKRACYEIGTRPAARCNAENVASRKTLQKAGLLPCARMLIGDVPDRK